MRRLKAKCSPMSLLTLTRSRQWDKKRMVYILLAGKKYYKYRSGRRSNIIYIGTTGKGAGRPAASAVNKASQVFYKLHGVKTKFGRSSRSSKMSVLPAFLTLLLAASLVAQKTPQPSPPKYDLHAETKIKGTIEEVKLPPKGSEKEIVHLLVKNGPDTMDVYLCPKSFFDDMGMGFSKGDEIALTGSKI